MRWVRSLIGAALALLAGAVATVLVMIDRIEQRRQRKRAEETAELERRLREEADRRAAEFRARVELARIEAERQRASALEAERKRLEDEKRARLERDPVDIANEAIERARRGS